MKDLIKRSIQEFLSENINNNKILTDIYFIKRIPFFKTFENNSGNNEVRFKYYKNWRGNDSAILHFGKNNGFVKFPFLSVETNFYYYTILKRDFDSEENLTVFKPMFKYQHNFIYWTDISMDLPKVNELDGLDEISKHIMSLMIKEIIKDNLKFIESFEVKDGETIPKDKLDDIINRINKNLFHIEETLEEMGLSYF